MSKVILFLICSVLSASAGLSKLEAISMIETGNNDAVVGRAGEVSRYQIKPRIWREYSPSRAWRDADISTRVAQEYLADLESQFLKRAGREATDFDLYVLWNAGPSYYARIDFSPRRVSPVIRERATRYVNLRQMRNHHAVAPVLASAPPVAPAAPLAPRVTPATPTAPAVPVVASPVRVAVAPVPALVAAPSTPSALLAPLPSLKPGLASAASLPSPSLLALGGLGVR